jgi:small GTP-binding protein
MNSNAIKDVEEETNEFPMMKKVSEYISKHDYMFRICLIGDSNVGKTSILMRYCNNTFKDRLSNTIGVDFRVVTLQYRSSFCKVHIWDTAGQERFKSISVNYFRSAHGFMFVYDVTNKNTFQNLGSWVDVAFNNNKSTLVNFLVGNKIDPEEKREVSSQEGRNFASFRDFIFFETSAKKNENVNKAFEFFAFKLIEKYSKDKNETIMGTQDDRLKIEGIGKFLEVSKKNKENCLC